MKNDIYIVEGMALSGQITNFFSKPNTGKTLLILWFLIRFITEGRLKGEDIFYINADDHYKGLFTKSKIAKKHGFEMISPAESGIPPKVILGMLRNMAVDGDADGKIIILDTLKKFVSMMDKNAQATLYEVLRELTAKNATVILAGHANKKLDDEGNLLYEGCGDTESDIDCMYSINLISDDGERAVEFRNTKSRGDVVDRASYAYTKREGGTYYDLLDSVRTLSGGQAKSAIKANKIEQLRKKYESEIIFVKEIIEETPMIQSDIHKAHKNAKSFALMDHSKKAYIRVKNGE